MLIFPSEKILSSIVKSNLYPYISLYLQYYFICNKTISKQIFVSAYVFFSENVSLNEQRQNHQKNNNSSPPTAQSYSTERVERPDRPERERVDSPLGSYSQSVREQPPPDTKPWGYSGIDLINTGAAFWQNYSG